MPELETILDKMRALATGPSDALASLAERISKSPGDPTLLEEAGRLLANQLEFRSGGMAARRALLLHPARPWAALVLSHFLLRNQRLDHAARHARQAHVIDASSEEIFRHLAEILHDLDHLDTLDRLARERLDHTADDPTAHFWLARTSTRGADPAAQSLHLRHAAKGGADLARQARYVGLTLTTTEARALLDGPTKGT